MLIGALAPAVQVLSLRSEGSYGLVGDQGLAAAGSAVGVALLAAGVVAAAVANDPGFIENNKASLCASLQKTIVEILLDKLVRASKDLGIRDIAIAGGVSANSGLRNGIVEEGRRRGWRTFLPEFKFTTDNAAMIAMAGYYRYQHGDFSSLGVSPVARLQEL